MKKQTFQHWHVTEDSDHILWLWLDKKNASANTLDYAVLGELNSLLDDIATKNIYKGVIIGSAKNNGFIAGADIELFTTMKSVDDAKQFIRHGQEIFDKLAALKIPTVAMIDGFCLGGGLELALACKYRVAEDSQKTKLGLPEIMLGIYPGWGGAVRLPQLIGPFGALDLILTGRTVNSITAAKMGIIDAAVPKRHLQRAAVYYIQNMPAVHQSSKLQQALNWPLVRSLIGKFLYKKVGKKARKDHYPAPYAVIDDWVRDGAYSHEAQINEIDSLGQLAAGDTSKNLIRVFFLQEKLKGLAKHSEYKAQHIHVVGAGVMGGDIAAWCCLRGLKVTLQDREAKFIAPAIKRAYELFKQKLKLPRLIQAAMDRLIPDIDGLGIPHADIIIEAISENISAKQKLFSHLEKHCKPEAILATNTSSIPLKEIYSALENPTRLIGIHFFNPVAKMPLVELVHDEKTDQNILHNALAFVRQLDRLPLPVTSTPGFLVNRVLMPYMMEAILLLQEGKPALAIDKAAVDFGMPMGPILLADTVGLDVCLSVAKHLLKKPEDKQLLKELEQKVAAGQLGCKTNQGFYSYKNGKPEMNKDKEHNNPHILTNDISERLVLRMLNETVACLREKVVADQELIDAGMIFGTGFAPFRGGPLHYADKLGYQTLKAQLSELAQRYGERFIPDKGWDQLS